MRGRTLARIAAVVQLCLLAGALIVPGAVAAATIGFTVNAPSLSTVQYSDLVLLKGSYTCVNDGAGSCPTTSQSKTATFSVRPAGGSTFLTVGTVTSSWAWPGTGCASTCTFAFQLTWKAGRAGSATVDPGVYDIGLTTTYTVGQQILLNGITVTKESTTTTYTGGTSGQGNTDLTVAATALDADLGLSPGTGLFSPDTNLLGADQVTFELFDGTNTTSVAGPVSVFLLGNGSTSTSGPPVLHLPASGGTFKLRTTYLGNTYYTSSSDLDTITVTASNTPPVLTVPASPLNAEASSPAGAYRTFSVSATDAEDVPAPTPTCDHASGALYPIGDTLVSCTVTDSGGLSDADSFTIHVADTTDPVMNVTTDESDNGAGWYNVASNDNVPGVTVEAITSDLVGVASLTCTVDGADVGPLDPSGDSFAVFDGSHAVECTATDGAGNHHTDSATFVVDQTAPTISASVSPDAAGSGWWNASTGAPTVTYSCSDAGSGLASCSGPHLFGEGADQAATGSATDVAGNSATASVSDIDVDLTAPSISASVSPDAAGSGWWNASTGAPTVTYSCSDATSGVASCSAPHLFGEGSGQGDTGSVSDNAGNTATTSVSGIDVDLTAPSISASVSPDAAATGWWNQSTGAPTVTYSCSDAGSGLASCSSPHLFGEGTGQGDTGTATDLAGNSNTASVSGISVDLTAPLISASVSPDAAGTGWWNIATGGPTVTYDCSDAGSGVASCSSPHLFGNGADLGDTGTATDVAGNSSTASVSDINVDLTAPSISASISPLAAGSGWWTIGTGGPTVSYSCSDAGSGMASCSPAHPFGEGAGQGDSGTATDIAGNSSSTSVSGVSVDLTAPSISAALSPASAPGGWWNASTGAPTVTYTCGDTGSGVASCSPAHLFGEGGGQSATGSSADVAGNTNTTTVSNVNVDLTAPSISASFSLAAAGTGWWNAGTGAPTVTFTCGDTGSGLAACSPAHVFAEGAGQGASGSATDVAGNSNSASVSGVNVDLVAPTGLAFVGGGLSNGASYVFGSVPGGPTGCTANGGTSGLLSCLVSGYSPAVGPHTVTALATDNAGNTSSISLSYTVLPWTLVGFASPISMTSLNTVKGGSSPSLKFQVFAGSTELISLDAIAAFTQTEISCATMAPIGPTTSALLGKNASLKYTSTFVAKWDPPATANTCWAVAIVTVDGSSLRATFQLK